MSEINQIALSRLLQAMSTSGSLNSSNGSSSNSSYDFLSVLSNSLLNSNNLGGSCTSCNGAGNLLGNISNLNNNNLYSNDLNALTTLLGSMNSDRINVNVNYVKPEDLKSNNANTIANIEISVGDSKRTENVSNSTSKSKMDKAVDLLKEQVGKKYVWGATGPNNFDCSGLTQYIYKKALGKNIPRVSYEQSEYGKSVKKKDLQVGDLIFFDTMGKGRVSHVGMYIGNNEFIHASNPRDGVKKSTLTGYYEKKYICARRP